MLFYPSKNPDLRIRSSILHCLLLSALFLVVCSAQGQRLTKTFTVSSDSIHIDSVPIAAEKFTLYSADTIVARTEFEFIDYYRAIRRNRHAGAQGDAGMA